MKLYKSLLATMTLALMSVSFTACDEDEAVAPLDIPKSEWKANMTIADFKAKYWQNTNNYCTEVGKTDSGEDIILGGRIIANDEGGNIYQNLMLQDATGAITIAVYTNSTSGLDNLYTRYKVGEEMFINVTKLYAGKYAGLFQIGAAGDYNGTPQTSKMEPADFLAHTQLNGLPNPSAVTVKEMTIEEINALSSTEEFIEYQSQRVRINGVSWIGGGKQTWGEPGASSAGLDRYLINEAGNRLLVRNSNKSDFCDQMLPEGHGDVIGILSYYNGKWQFVFQSPDDCIDFGGESYVPETDKAVVTSLNINFENVSDISELGNWKTIDSEGNATWFVQKRDQDNNTFAACTGYKKTAGANGFDSWFITPGLDIDGMTEKVFSFQSMVGNSGNGTLEVYAMTTPNPATATLTKLDVTIPQPTGSYSNWINSGNVDLSAYTDTIYIGFRYKADVSTADKYTTYRIDNILAGAKQEEGGDTPNPPAAGATFKKVTSVTAGKQYVFVIDGQVGAPIDANLGYGRLTMTAVTINGDELTTSTDNAITIKAVDGGYSLTDYLGRSLDMDATHLSTFQLGATGNVWTITPVDGLFQIANVLNPNCWIVRSGTYSNIAPSDVVKYPTYDLPALYERVN